ncbi:modification methylase bstVI [Clostridium cochlearium]|nr:TaqI-like C-terminal specificity domain-containing protein [Clostridium cochlearium]SNV86255.1 modification methylase bstVI [Clostridium cochlearium]STA93363.1 modification methylase bstVI [Clostridium cochlearium]
MINILKDIENLYNVIVQPIDNVYKNIAIENYRKKYNLKENELMRDLYISNVEKKSGVVYTTEKISNYLVRNTIKEQDIINNPYIKIVDPSCGCGNIIFSIFDYLNNIYINNIEEINKKNNLRLSLKGVKRHIVNNNLYAIDIDNLALKILVIDFFYKNYVIFPNIQNKDFLTDNIEEKFNVFIGNPPYIGHKDVGKEYFKNIKENYGEIYINKSDLSYCFFKGSFNKGENDCKITFITSRYFLESESGKNLRRYIANNFYINKIVDFYGIRPFKNIGIDPCIIFLTKIDENNIYNNRKTEIIKPSRGDSKKNEFIENIINNKEIKYRGFLKEVKEFKKDRWLLINEQELNILKKIESKCKISLKEICNSYQGIISGCDKAFIVNRKIIETKRLEKTIIKPWIKSSHIKKTEVENKDMFLIYSNEIKDENKYPNIINHLYEYVDKLKNRRECRNGIRKWYELQWGRKKEIFEGEKIIFPYKSKNNIFVLDKGNYFSADVYCMFIKEDMKYDYEFLTSILNSKIYEFYFQCFGKKLGENLYEYYPNTVMEMKIPDYFKKGFIKEQELYDYFNLTEEEKEIVVNE